MAGTYQWSTGATTASITVGAGSYSLTVTNAAGCTYTDSIVVTESIRPVVDLGADISICPGTTATLAPVPEVGHYLWSTGDTTATITVATAGTYWLQITNGSGCTATDTVEVHVFDQPTVNLGPDTAICSGELLTLDAGPAATYLWSTGQTTRTIQVLEAGAYTVSITNANGCTATDQVVVTYNNDLGACGTTGEVCTVTDHGKHALWIPGIPNTSNEYFFVADTGVFTQFNDGTALLTGTIKNKHNPNKRWVVNFYFTGKTDWAAWSAMKRSYKGSRNRVGIRYLQWNYYIFNPDVPSTLVGDGEFAGDTLYATHKPSNYKYGLQIGYGANDKNNKYGISTWFDYSGSYSGRGDVNVNAACAPDCTTPQVSLGPDFHMCGPDGTATLTATINNYDSAQTYSYYWKTPSGAGQAGDTTQSLFINERGTYTVTVFTADGCVGEDKIKVERNLFALDADIDLCNDKPYRGQALFVRGKSKTVTPVDAQVMSMLEGEGFEVTVKHDREVASWHSNGKHLIVVSSTVHSGRVGSKFTHVDVPFITWESYLYDDLHMTGRKRGTDYGFGGSTTTIELTDSTHTLAAGYSGAVAVSTTASQLRWGKPNAHAKVMAWLPGHTERAVYFAYDRGAALVNGMAAPARRIAFHMFQEGDASTVAPATWHMLQASIQWAVGADTTSHPVLNAFHHKAVSYLWHTPNESGQAGQTTARILGETPGTYYATVTLNNGCVLTDSITVTGGNKPYLNLGPDQTACLGSTVTLASTASDANHVWSTGATSPTLTVTQPGTYWVTASYAGGCAVTDTVEVYFDNCTPDCAAGDVVVTPLCQEADNQRRWSLQNNYNTKISVTWHLVGTTYRGRETVGANANYTLKTPAHHAAVDTLQVWVFGLPHSTVTNSGQCAIDYTAVTGQALCSYSQSSEVWWKITNPLQVTVQAQWQAPGTAYSGTATVQPGQSQLITTGSSAYTVQVTVGNHSFTMHRDTTLCAPVAAYSDVRLTSMCSPEPDKYRVWRVRNPYSYPIQTRWRVHGTQQRGELLAPPNTDVFFETVTVGGANTTLLFVNGNQHQVKASGTTACRPETSKVKLTSFCSDNPGISRRWRVINPYSYALPITWDVYGTSQTGSFIAPPNSHTYFETKTQGSNTVRVFAYGRQEEVKASSGATCNFVCDPGQAPTEAAVTDTQQQDVPLSQLRVSVFPNPTAQPVFRLRLSALESVLGTETPLDLELSQMQVVMYDFSGRAIPIACIKEGTATYRIEAKYVTQGMYLLKVMSRGQVVHKQVQFMK